MGSFSVNSLFGGGMVNIAKLIARYVGRFIGLDVFSNKEWSCHADELLLMWKSPFIPFDTIYTGTICMPSKGILVAEQAIPVSFCFLS